MSDGVRILPYGEAAVLVELGDAVELRLARRAQALAAVVRQVREDAGMERASAPAAGSAGAAAGALRAPVPGAASVLVPFDPLACDMAPVVDLLRPLVIALPEDPAPDPAARDHEIPVRYGGADGPDLDPVARELGATAKDVVALHAGATLEVLFIGFAPGFPYLGEVPDALVVPRLATPRTLVPAGSVGLAGRLTGIYPRASPGGWRIIGRTDRRLFDPAADPPCRLRPGDRVRFVPVGV